MRPMQSMLFYNAYELNALWTGTDTQLDSQDALRRPS